MNGSRAENYIEKYMTEFKKISSIKIDNNSTWSSQIFLTLDFDWAHDAIISDTLNLLEKYGTQATCFITHESEALYRCRTNDLIELGVHPNFNSLLGDKLKDRRTASEVLAEIMELVPDARSVRSHSMTQSTRLLDEFKRAGLTHDVNHFIPSHLNIELKPWALWNGMSRVPYMWEDDIFLAYRHMNVEEKSPVELLQTPGLKVLDFHPIHIFLNTEDLSRYNRTRSLHQYPDELINHRFEGYGTRNRLIDLLEKVANL